MSWEKEKLMFKRGGAAKRERLDVKARRQGFWHSRFCAVGRLIVLVLGLGWMGWKGIRTTVDAFLLRNDAFALRYFTSNRRQAKPRSSVALDGRSTGGEYVGSGFGAN